MDFTEFVQGRAPLAAITASSSDNLISPSNRMCLPSSSSLLSGQLIQLQRPLCRSTAVSVGSEHGQPGSFGSSLFAVVSARFQAGQVFLFQKAAIFKCNMVGRPTVVTRVVDSMTDNLRHTRAKATDVVNAILDGTDAIILGAETLRGWYPVETISVVGRICYEG